MNGFSFLFLALALFVAFRALQSYALAHGSKKWARDERARIRNIIEQMPSNAGARAQLAGFLLEDGDVDGAIAELRAAIELAPQGPFTTEWTRKLKAALETQAILARGEKVAGFHEWRVCEKCQAQVAAGAKTCPQCGATLNMSFVEWLLNSGTQRDIWRQSVPIALVLWICSVVFMSLPLEWKGMIIISSVMVGGYLMWRSMEI